MKDDGRNCIWLGVCIGLGDGCLILCSSLKIVVRRILTFTGSESTVVLHTPDRIT